mmetsp:Transcript_9490/g.19432  ORF Transcript_9490/g.19432 Transcript_9490/m.19432 type:complete len:84 (-) Transcript_9490:2321-2572(-)
MKDGGAFEMTKIQLLESSVGAGVHDRTFSGRGRGLTDTHASVNDQKSWGCSPSIAYGDTASETKFPNGMLHTIVAMDVMWPLR